MIDPNAITAAFTQKMQSAAKDMASAFYPSCDNDYVRIKRFMVAKSLLVAVLLILNVMFAAVLFLLWHSAPTPQAGGIRAYRYSSLRLRGYTGVATVLDKNKNPVYTGDLAKGKATGYGELKDHAGTPVYAGSFLENRYHGEGELYYPDGAVKYHGSFQNNLFHGTGTLYHPNGAKSYEGGFSAGKRQGAGTLCDESGRMIYSGNFVMDSISFLGYLSGGSASLGDFGGERVLYTGVYETSVWLRDFGVIYVLGENGGEEAEIVRMYDVSGAVSPSREPCGTNELRELLGTPFYAGYADILAPDLAAADALKHLGRLSRDNGLEYGLSASANGIYEIIYPHGQKLYLETYRDGDLFYTYYFLQNTKPYLFYSVERAQDFTGEE